MTYKNDVIDSVITDMDKAAKILSGIDHNLAFVDCGNAMEIIRSINNLISYIAEDLNNLRDPEDDI
jgi:hypothetical protein